MLSVPLIKKGLSHQNHQSCPALAVAAARNSENLARSRKGLAVAVALAGVLIVVRIVGLSH